MYHLTYSHQKRTPWHKGDEVESRRLERGAQRNVVLMWLTGRPGTRGGLQAVQPMVTLKCIPASYHQACFRTGSL